MGARADTLQMIIAHALGIHTTHVETGSGWTSADGKHAWAFLAVGSEAEGTALIKRIGQITRYEFGGAVETQK